MTLPSDKIICSDEESFPASLLADSFDPIIVDPPHSPSQSAKLICGEAASVLKEKFPDNHFDLAVTSPPYDKLRNYGSSGFVFDFQEIARQIFRVLKPGGVLVWVVGDSVGKTGKSFTSFRQALYFKEIGFYAHDHMIYEKNTSSFPARRNGKRYTQIFENMFVLSKLTPPKTANLIFDKPNRWAGWINWGKKSHRNVEGELVAGKDIKPVPEFSPRNNIWRYNVGAGYGQKSKIAYRHPATFPEALVKDHILSWSNVGDTVLDPFVGSGTTVKVAKILGRNSVGIDANPDYIELAKLRLGEESIAENKLRVPRTDPVLAPKGKKHLGEFE